jgi:hypothetical protein
MFFGRLGQALIPVQDGVHVSLCQLQEGTFGGQPLSSASNEAIRRNAGAWCNHVIKENLSILRQFSLGRRHWSYVGAHPLSSSSGSSTTSNSSGSGSSNRRSSNQAMRSTTP